MLLIPPAVKAEERPEWTSPGDLMAASFLVGAIDERHLAMVAACEGMADARSRPDDFRAHLSTFAEHGRELAAARGEGDKVDLEVTYYKMDFFYRSLVLYVLAFLMVAITWVRRGMRKLFGAALAVTTLGAGLHVAGIVVRCGHHSVVCITDVQREGRRRMPADAFLIGERVSPGERFV